MRLINKKTNPIKASKCVWLTDAGRSLRGAVIADLAPDIAGLMAGFDVDRLIAILPVLRDLRLHMDAHRNAEPPRDRAVPPRES